MARNKLFGGVNLREIATSVAEKGEASPVESSAVKPTLAAAEFAIRGRAGPTLERENILSVDPHRCRPWKYHNRLPAWYTRERCEDLIESIARDGQLEPAVARRIDGDPNYDFELIFGMRRRYACELAGVRLRIRVVEVDDAKAAVLMHIENADRQDITPMERALSFLTQVEARVFPTQDAMADALGVSKSQVAKMLKAAGLLKHTAIAALFGDKTQIPVEQAYQLAAVMEKPGAKDVVLQAASNLARKGVEGRRPAEILKTLMASLDRSKKIEALRKEYNVGAAGRVVVTRNPKGKVTWAFPKGVGASDREAVLAAVERILADLG